MASVGLVVGGKVAGLRDLGMSGQDGGAGLAQKADGEQCTIEQWLRDNTEPISAPPDRDHLTRESSGLHSGNGDAILRRKTEFRSRFLPLPPQSFFLLGPRGTGKSTWLRQVLPDALVIDLLRPEIHRELVARPERLRERVFGAPERSTVVIDEVQRVPELLSVVHGLIEERSRRQFVLTGSSARKLRRGGVNLLAGRALQREMHPFMAAELGAFSLAEALVNGTVPLVVTAPSPGQVLDAYVGLYLDQEVRAEGWARNAGDFARFLEAISFSHGAVLNLANVARECEVQRRTVTGYVDVLEDLLLAYRVPVFTRRAGRATSTHPKFYLFDTGVFRSLRPAGPLDRPAEVEGAALEGLVAQHLRAWIAYSGRRCELFFWRTRSGVEVDFVVYGAGGFWALDVQGSGQVRPRDLEALRAFKTDYPGCTAALLYRGADRRLIDGIWCLPVDDFLRTLHPANDVVALPATPRR